MLLKCHEMNRCLGWHSLADRHQQLGLGLFLAHKNPLTRNLDQVSSECQYLQAESQEWWSSTPFIIGVVPSTFTSYKSLLSSEVQSHSYLTETIGF